MVYPLAYAGLGQTTVVAGRVNGVSTLRQDVQISAQNASRVYGTDLTYDKGAFRSLLRRFKDDPAGMEGTRLEPAQVRNFVIGVVSECAAAVARAEQLAELRVAGPMQQAENHRAQAELVGAGRLMLDSCNTMLRSVVPVERGASGLGVAPIVVGAIAVVAVIVGIAAVAAIALVADSMNRMIQARATAQRICQEAEGGCTAEQYADIVAQLRLGPFDQLARGGEVALRSAGAGAATTMVLVGGGVLAIGGLWFLFGTKAGRKTLEGIGARKRGAAA